MNANDVRAVANLQLTIALRLDEANLLEKIVASEYETPRRKNLARERLAKLRQASEADEKELERLKAGGLSV